MDLPEKPAAANPHPPPMNNDVDDEIGRLLAADDPSPGNALLNELNKKEKTNVEEVDEVSDEALHDFVDGVFSDSDSNGNLEDEEVGGDDGNEVEVAEKSVPLIEWEKLVIDPGKPAAGYGKPVVDWHEVERQEMELELMAKLKEVEKQKPTLLQQVQTINRNAREIADQAAPRPSNQLVLNRPPNQAQPNVHTDLPSSAANSPRVPVQRVVAKNFVINRPARPSIPSLMFNGLDPQVAFNELALGRSRHTLAWANKSAMDEMLSVQEQYTDFLHLQPENFQLLHSLRQVDPNGLGVSYPPGDSALLCLKSRETLELNLMGAGEKDDLRRNQIFHKIIGDLRIRNPDPKLPNFDHKQVPHRASIKFENLAINKIRLAKQQVEPEMFESQSICREDEDFDSCTFCLFDCDFGIHDARFWLDHDITPGYCMDCHRSTAFFDLEWRMMVQEKFARFDGVDKEIDTAVRRGRVNQLMHLNDDHFKPLKEVTEQGKAVARAKENWMPDEVDTSSRHRVADSNRTNFDSDIMKGIVVSDRLAKRVPSDQIGDGGYRSRPTPQQYQENKPLSNPSIVGVSGQHQQNTNHEAMRWYAGEIFPRQRQEYQQILNDANGGNPFIQSQQQRIEKSMEIATGALQVPMLGDFTQQGVTSHSSNTADNESDYGPVNLRGGGEDPSYQESSDEGDDVPRKRIQKSGKAQTASGSDSQGPSIGEPSNPTPSARKKPLPALSDKKNISAPNFQHAQGKAVHPARQPTIEHEPKTQEEDDEDENEEDEDENHGNYGGKQLFGLGKNPQAATSIQPRGRNIASTPTPSKQRAASSASARSQSATLQSSTDKIPGNASASTPSFKRGASSAPNSSEPLSKKFRKQRSLVEELEANPDYLIPSPPKSEGLTVSQIAKALKDAEQEAKTRGLPIPKNLAEVEAQNLIAMPTLSTARQRKFDEASQKYRDVYGNRYAEQQAKFRAEGHQNVSSTPRKVSGDGKSTPSTGGKTGLPNTPAPRKPYSTTSANGPNATATGRPSSASKVGKISSLSAGVAIAVPESGMSPPPPPAVGRQSSAKPGSRSSTPSAQSRSYSQPQFTPNAPTSLGARVSASPVPRQSEPKNGFRSDTSSAMGPPQASPRIGMDDPRPYTSPDRQREGSTKFAEKSGLESSANQSQMSISSNIAAPKSTPSQALKRKGVPKPVVNSGPIAATNQAQSSSGTRLDQGHSQAAQRQITPKPVDSSIRYTPSKTAQYSPERDSQRSQPYQTPFYNGGSRLLIPPQYHPYGIMSNHSIFVPQVQAVTRSGTYQNTPFSSSRSSATLIDSSSSQGRPTTPELPNVDSPQSQAVARPAGPLYVRPNLSPSSPSPVHHALGGQGSSANLGLSNGGSPQSLIITRPANRPKCGSKVSAIHAGFDPRNRPHVQFGPLSHSHPSDAQAGTPRRQQFVPYENYTPRNPSGLRQSQLPSPMARSQPQPPHAEFVSHMSHDHMPFPHQPFQQQPPHFGPPPPRSPSPATNNERLNGIIFCRGCPWSQVDVTKVRICGPCKATKLAIIMHRHYVFLEISKLDAKHNGYFGEDHDKALSVGKKMRSCMICPGRAVWVCRDCPLRLCESCKAYTVSMCKGKVENLLMHLYRLHVRNDAFLLRSDGGGF